MHSGKLYTIDEFKQAFGLESDAEVSERLTKKVRKQTFSYHKKKGALIACRKADIWLTPCPKHDER